MGTWAIVALVLAGAATGCSDDGGSDDDADRSTTTTAATSDQTAPDTQGPCPFVSTEAIAEAMALPVELVDGGADGCDFILGDAATLLITAEPEADAEGCAAGSLVEADDDWVCIIDDVPTAVVTADGASVALTVTGEVAAEATRDALVRLIPDITPAA